MTMAEISEFLPMNWAVDDAATLDDIQERAYALHIHPHLLIDHDYTLSCLVEGRHMPAWADSWKRDVSSQGFFIDGHYGNVTIGIAIVFGKNRGCTSESVAIDVGDGGWEEMRPSEMRALAANLEAAADAIGGVQ